MGRGLPACSFKPEKAFSRVREDREISHAPIIQTASQSKGPERRLFADSALANEWCTPFSMPARPPRCRYYRRKGRCLFRRLTRGLFVLSDRFGHFQVVRDYRLNRSNE